MKLIDQPQLSKEQAQKLCEAMLRRAGQARKNPARFYEFVIREETTRTRVKTLPHQELVFKFVQHYPRCVLRMPPGFSKTYMMAALSMWLIGNDNTTRGAIISAAQGQAQKPLGMVRDYITDSAELKLVFPKLHRSSRSSDSWTQSKLTVERPSGIRDASLSAVGVHGKLPGSRLSWILVDDILSEENTATAEQRDAVWSWFLSTVLARRDAKGSRIVVSNTPWHPEDVTFRLEKAGWPTLTMDAWGNITFQNADDFDCDDIRPSDNDPKGEAHRLTAHDSPVFAPHLSHLTTAERAQAEAWFDADDEVYLWPERFGPAVMDELKTDYADSMHQFHQLFSMKCRDDESGRVKVEWIDKCKKRARDAGIFTFTSKWTEGRTFTGVDLGVGRKKGNDRTSVFTFGLLPDKTRRLLRIDSGRWSGVEIIDKLVDHRDSYNSIIRVETNAAQDFLRQWALERDRSLPVRSHHTGMNKHSKQHGVESVFVELENTAWLIPNDPTGKVDPATQRWIDAMLYYDPDKHTGDELMACWLARLEASEKGLLRKPKGQPPPGPQRPTPGPPIMSR